MTYVTVDVDLEEIDTDDLKAELRSRGYFVGGDDYIPTSTQELVRIIFEKRRLGQNYQREIDELIYAEIGRIL
jgi:hypothetical protein